MKKMGLACSLLVAVAVGCGGGDDDDDDGGVSVAITASEGGVVAIGDATLTIPPDALEEDTTITARTGAIDGLPDAASLAGLAYDFGPDGTTFVLPATLELPAAGTAGEGQEAVIAWLDDDAWLDLPTTVASADLSAQIEHFSRFAARFRDATPAECSFQACGGDPVGSWTIESACLESSESPLGQSCEEATIEVVYVASGSASFAAGGDYNVTTELNGDVTIVVPASCSAILGDREECAGLLGEGVDAPVCIGDPASSCSCVEEIVESDSETGTYEVTGDELSLTPDGDNAHATEFCVSGDSLKFLNSGSVIFTATR